MDQKELMERLQRDPSALQRIIQSQDGQTLLRLLQSGGSRFDRAAKQAAAGNTAQMLQMLRTIMSTPEGAALLRRIGGSVQG